MHEDDSQSAQIDGQSTVETSDETTGMELGRRNLLKALSASAGYVAARLALPALWASPMVASIALPAHAAMSCASVDAATTPVDASITVKATATSGGVDLEVTLPASRVAAGQAFVVCEKVSSSIGVSTTLLPSSDATLSGTMKQSLKRGAGSYEYQVRWADGKSSWSAPVVVVAK